MQFMLCRVKDKVVAREYARFMMTTNLGEASAEALDDAAAKLGITLEGMREAEAKRVAAANTIAQRHRGLAYKVCPVTPAGHALTST
jgi:hypothetical protein